MSCFQNYLVSVHIIVLGQEKTLYNFHVELLAFKSLSFFPSAITGWNSLDLDIRNSVSLPTFKAKLRSSPFPRINNKLFDFSFSKRASIDHTRLRLGFSCLREYLLKINRCASPICECGLESESVKHFFFVFPQVCRST